MSSIEALARWVAVIVLVAGMLAAITAAAAEILARRRLRQGPAGLDDLLAQLHAALAERESGDDLTDRRRSLLVQAETVFDDVLIRDLARNAQLAGQFAEVARGLRALRPPPSSGA